MSPALLLPAFALAIAPVPQAPVRLTQAAPMAAPADAAPVAAPIDTSPAPEARERPPRTPGDPLEGFNRFMFRIFQKVDKAVLRPVAMGYQKIVPKVVRSGVRHALSNIGEPVVFLNDMLQLRPGRALRTFGRFAINTTLGVGGLIDVATPEKLPHRPNGLGDTLGFYGVKPGPYIFVPFLGPTTLRDLAGGTGDGLVLPTVVGSPFDRTDYRIATAVVRGLDARAESDAELTTLYDTSLDPYATLRSVYLQSRVAEIAALKAPGRNLPGAGGAPDDPLADPALDPAASSAPTDQNPATSDPLTDPAAPAGDPAAPVATPAS